MNPEEQLRITNETLYKHSHELAVKNKALSFLGKLYEIGVLTLTQKQLAEQVVGAGEEWLTEMDTDQLRNLLLLDRSAVIDEDAE